MATHKESLLVMKKICASITDVLLHTREALYNVLNTFFTEDTEVQSSELLRLLSDPDDAKQYYEAVDKVKDENVREITVVFSGNREITFGRL